MPVLAGRSPWLRWSVIAALALVALLVILNVTGYPALTRDPQFSLYIAILALVLAVYLGLTLWWTGRIALAPALRWGRFCGLGAGIGWLIEIAAGNLAVGQGWSLFAYFGGTSIALGLTLAAGVAGALIGCLASFLTRFSRMRRRLPGFLAAARQISRRTSLVAFPPPRRITC